MKFIINKIIVVSMVLIAFISNMFADFNSTEAETHFTQMAHAISQADHDMAERMCGVCFTKIEKYKIEINAEPIPNEMEIKTLETYEGRLQKFCNMKNQPVEK
jgi:phosphatidylinositol kinase/protein kinase (PI-3  family)